MTEIPQPTPEALKDSIDLGPETVELIKQRTADILYREERLRMREQGLDPDKESRNHPTNDAVVHGNNEKLTYERNKPKIHGEGSLGVASTINRRDPGIISETGKLSVPDVRFRTGTTTGDDRREVVINGDEITGLRVFEGGSEPMTPGEIVATIEETVNNIGDTQTIREAAVTPPVPVAA